MKKTLISLVLVLSLTTLPGVVHAQDTSQAPEESSSPELTDEETSSDGAGRRAERLQKYKDRLAVRLSANEERVLRNSCTAAQEMVAKVSNRVARVRENREESYATISERLNDLVVKVEIAGVDATSLNDAIVTMESEVSIFKATLDEYETILSDLAEMDCESDPQAFRAALSAAKQHRVTLVSSSQGIRQYFDNTIKPILQQLREDLST